MFGRHEALRQASQSARPLQRLWDSLEGSTGTGGQHSRAEFIRVEISEHGTPLLLKPSTPQSQTILNLFGLGLWTESAGITVP
jgi:hypothetical protein